MTTFLSQFAERHFEEHPRQSLLAGLAARIDGRNLIQALATGCRPLQHLAWQKLSKWDEADVNSLVDQALSNDGPELPDVLKAISHESIPVADSLIERVAPFMESPRAGVRLAAARVIAMKKPLEAIAFLHRAVQSSPSSDEQIDGHAAAAKTEARDVHSDRSNQTERTQIATDVLRTLCLADEPSLILPLMKAFGFPQRVPPPTIGFLVTPEWLADNYSRDPQAVEWLIRNCGYCEAGMCDEGDVGEAVSREALNLFSSGFSFVTTRMTSEPRMTKVAHRWQRRIRAFVWQLLPEELDMERDDTKPLNAADPFEIELFLAAIRDSDRSLFLEQKAWPPFDRRLVKRVPTPTCFHASTTYLRRRFISEPLAQADEWNIASELRGAFLIDAARALLEPNEEARTAAELSRRSRWLPRRSGSVSLNLTRNISNYQPVEPDIRLSPGADSVKNLAAACGLDWRAIADWLADSESNWSRVLTPIGIEVQIPKIDPDAFTLAKEMLQVVGVPSPRRLEFGGMVEAAFRPARSFHAMILGPLLLHRIGVVAEPQDMAIHISLQGELDDRAKFLAFPHLFIHPSQRLENRPNWSMARVMSKGFVHVHHDAEELNELIENDVTSMPVSTPRTELRLFRLFSDQLSTAQLSDGQIGGKVVERAELSDSYVSDVIAVQILGSALLSDCPQCQTLFGEYACDVQAAAAELPHEFDRLLNANYFESTGDPRDESLLNLLPIFRLWRSVRDVVRQQGLASQLDLQFQTIRNRHVKKMLNHMSFEHGLEVGGLEFIGDSIHLSLPPVLQITSVNPRL